MNKAAYRDEIKLRLTGCLLELELDDSTLDKVIDAGLRELQRYICSTRLMTIPFSKCIDMSLLKDSNGLPIHISSVSRIYRTQGYIGTEGQGDAVIDPMYVSQ